MRAVTFYSYKGGTGRSLLLANVAVLAARLGHSVVVIDADLEAPGLSYKFGVDNADPNGGLVGWLRERFLGGQKVESVRDRLVEIPVEAAYVPGGQLRLLPAGAAPEMCYFSDLVAIGLEARIDSGDGVDAFVDLKDVIETELDPDFLFIDARTGVSGTTRVCTRVLADDIVALTLDTAEQLDGTRSVLRSLAPLTSMATAEPIRLHAVLARISSKRSPETGVYDLSDAEDHQVTAVHDFLEEPASPLSTTLRIEKVHLVHNDPTVMRAEFLPLNRIDVDHAALLHVDYIRVSEAVLGDVVATVAANAIRESGSEDAKNRLAAFFARTAPGLASSGGASVPGAPMMDLGVEPPTGTTIDRVDSLRRKSTRGDTASRLALGHQLLQLSTEQSAIGDREAALRNSREAVAVFRELASTHSRYEPLLGTALEQYARRVARVPGHNADALVNVQESVAVYRRLHETDDRYRVHLATALNNYSAVLRRAGGGEVEALAAVEEAVSLRSTMPTESPKQAGAYARTLMNLAVALQQFPDRAAESVAAVREAVELIRNLDQDSPDTRAWLATGLDLLSNRIDETGGHPGDALAASEEAVRAYRAFVTDDSPVEYRTGIAGALNNLSNRLGLTNRVSAESLELIEESVNRYRALVNEGEERLLHPLSTALFNLSSRLRDQGQYPERAVEAAIESVAIRRQLAQIDALPAPLDLATSLSGYATCAAEIPGRVNEAVASASESVALRRRLVGAGQATMLDLADGLHTLGSILAKANAEMPATLSHLEEAAAIYRERAAAGDPLARREVGAVLQNLSAALAAGGRVDEAEEVAHEVVSIFRDALPGERFESSLASGLGHLANLREQGGDRDGAERALAEAVQIRRRLGSDGAARHIEELVRTLNDFAGVLEAHGRVIRAEKLRDEAQSVAANLLRGRPPSPPA